MWGSGIPKIISVCRESELPEPLITEDFGGFLVEVFKHRYNEENLRKLDLNERQIKAVRFVVEYGKIDNKKYQELFDVSRNTASNDLTDLVQLSIFRKIGTKGASVFYDLALIAQ